MSGLPGDPHGGERAWMAPMFGVAMVLAAVVLGGGFGEATAVAGPEPDGQLRVEVSLRPSGPSGPVVAHFVLPAGDGPSLSLQAGDGGVWAGSVELRRADWRVVFEDLATGEISPAVSLTELGVAREALVEGVVSLPPEPGVADTSPLWLGLAVLAGLGSIALLRVRPVRPRHLRPTLRRRRSEPS